MGSGLGLGLGLGLGSLNPFNVAAPIVGGKAIEMADELVA
jgi:hypothetical protein